MAAIGDLSETHSEITTEWRIRDFSSLSQEEDLKYKSYKFYFSGSSWELRMYPYGDNTGTPNKWISLYLAKISVGLRVTVDFSIGFKTADGKIDLERKATNLFEENEHSLGWNKFIERSVVIERKSEFIISDTITIICSVKNSKKTPITGSLFSRHQELSDNLKTIYENEKKTDVILQVAEKNISAHRMILEARSPVFAAMFTHDTKENRTGEVIIQDSDEYTMNAVLKYMYSGDIEKLETENVLSIYTAADKYDLKDLKQICLEFIKLNLSVDWVCDVIKFAELYQDEETSRLSKEYFKENAELILATEKWNTFVKENHEIGVELLSTVVKTLLRK